jgi:hypothetical protein
VGSCSFYDDKIKRVVFLYIFFDIVFFTKLSVPAM